MPIPFKLAAYLLKASRVKFLRIEFLTIALSLKDIKLGLKSQSVAG